jgi:hypothetical protein
MVTVKECSERAAACERLAEQAKDPALERWYLSLVKTWRIVAEISESMDRSEWYAVARSIQSGSDSRK